MKKSIAFILLLFSLCGCFFSCGGKYPPVKSTREESRVTFNLSAEKEKYEIKYELYRALFLANKNKVDGGDDSVWVGENKGKYIEEIDEIIISEASKIYSAIHLAEKLGLSPYSRDAESRIDEYIRIGVEGGYGYGGYEGDYDAYLDAIYGEGMNYAVHRLMLRHSVALEMINDYYKGFDDPVLGKIEGEAEVGREQLSEFYFSDECVRIFQAFIGKDGMTNAEAKANSLRDGIIQRLGDETEMALYIITNTAQTPIDLIKDKKPSGLILTRSSVDNVYTELIDTAFALEEGQVSEIIYHEEDNGYYILYKLEKDEDHFSYCEEDIKEAFFENMISQKLSEICDQLISSAKKANGYKQIRQGEIDLK